LKAASAICNDCRERLRRECGNRLATVRYADGYGLFFSRDIGAGPYQAALGDLATRHDLSISDSARMFAAVDVSLADTIFAVWDGKFHYGKWRPITAIREADTDGDPNTAGVPGWTPLIPTPNYPDYPSGLSGVTGDLSTALARLGLFDLNITSPDPTRLPRHYTDPAIIQADIIDAGVFKRHSLPFG